MAVTIGEFEVVNEPGAAAAAPAAPAAAPTLPDALELQRLLAQLHEQALRLWAH